ncbi:DUF5713 family protein [Streptomyces sp. NPDC059247]|uniref:DUF5713 family protein n=1 Tax=Streptomyces sp. NPDC059247 TaxID=3346790 RepID=UPI0036CF5981
MLLSVRAEGGHFPDHVVDKEREVLLRLCERIEADRPADLAALYVLTHAATEEIPEDFRLLATAYGFVGVGPEELIATRAW